MTKNDDKSGKIRIKREYVCERRKLYMTEFGKAQRRRARVIEEEEHSAHIFIGENYHEDYGKESNVCTYMNQKKKAVSFIYYVQISRKLQLRSD